MFQLPENKSKHGAADVMFYTHGGGWFSGTGGSYLHGPEFLMDRNIVLVTINYRLGALGESRYIKLITKHEKKTTVYVNRSDKWNQEDKEKRILTVKHYKQIHRGFLVTQCSACRPSWRLTRLSPPAT